VGGLRTAAQLDTVCPHGLKYAFIEEYFVGQGKLGAAIQEPGHGAKFKVEVLALVLDMLSPGQLTVKVKAEVPSVGFYRDG